MRIVRRIILGMVMLAAHQQFAGAAEPTQDLAALAREFAAPPDASRPHTLWHWMNGHVTKAGITKDLEAMKAAGLGGFLMWNCSEGTPPGPVKYMSPEWWGLLDHTMAESARLGLEMKMHNCAGWSSTAGPWVTPDRAMQEVVWTEKQVSGPAEFDGDLEVPVPVLGLERDMKKNPEANKRYFVPRETLAGQYHDLRLFAFPTLAGDKAGKPCRLDKWREQTGVARKSLPGDGVTKTVGPGDVVDPGKVIDLTGKLDKAGHLRWSVPPGDWTILRVGYQPTGVKNHPAPIEGKGLEVDKLTAEALDYFWDQSLGKVVALAKDRGFGKTFCGIEVDSYEVGHQTWRVGLPEIFRKDQGYDLFPHLIALTGRVVGNIADTEDFLWDFRQTLGNLMVHNYFGRFAELCHKNGLQFINEPYGGYGIFNAYSVAAQSDIPMTEFWFGDKHNYSRGKLVSSAIHTRGLPIADAEAYTGYPNGIFSEYPFSMKPLGDSAFCAGINRFSFHTFVHDPYDVPPGLGLGVYGSRFDRRNTWWPFIRPWMDYLARCQHLLRQGQFVAELIYYMGENSTKDEAGPEALRPRPPVGYDYDLCDRSILMQMKVADGRLVLPSGMSYRILTLPDERTMSPEVMRKVADLVQSGATVIGPKPKRVPGLSGRGKPTDDMLRLANEVWGDCDGTNVTSHAFGKGRVYWNEPMEKVTASLGLVPAFQWSLRESDKTGQSKSRYDVQFIHRRMGGADVYFVSNQLGKEAALNASFRTAGHVAELWYPDSGKIESVPVQKLDGDWVSLSLHMDKAGSVFVVFPPVQTPGAVPADLRKEVGEIAVAGPWKIAFQPGRGAPESIELTVLSDLAKNADSRVKYFSGTVTYKTTFECSPDQCPKGTQAMLDLGNVEVIASVRLNGQELGIAWKAPYRVEATSALRPGRNELEIQVANLWLNRVIGDLKEPKDCKLIGDPETNMRLAEIPDWVREGKPRPSTNRFAFVATHWGQLYTMAPKPSGLIGPVRLILRAGTPAVTP